MKISDHHVQSPLLSINRACQGCHHFSEAEMKSRVEQIQDRFHAARDVAMNALMDLIADLKKAKEDGAGDKDLAGARAMQRKAQFYIDMVEAENSTGFHAPGEELRILTEAVDFCRKGQLALRQGKPKLVARTR
jgi:nitrite reductase (cytochrome c-552)